MDPLRDAPRTINFSQNGITITMRKDGEHQFYYLDVDKGKLPERFQCAFTNYEAAKLAVDQIFEDRRKKKAA